MLSATARPSKTSELPHPSRAHPNSFSSTFSLCYHEITGKLLHGRCHWAHFCATSWDNGIKQIKLWLHKAWSLPETLFLHQSTPTEGDYLDYKTPCALLSIWLGMEDAHRSCWTQDRGMGMTQKAEKTPCPGNSDSAVQSLLCYLPRAISSHKIFHSVTRPEKALWTPKSWSLIITPGAHPPPQKEPSSAPSDLPGTHCKQFILCLKGQAKITGAGFSAFMAI